MASIEIWTRNVSGAPYVPGKGIPQHTFYIKSNNDGTREIMRGGPERGNMLVDDNVIVRQDYNGPYQDDGTTRTYDWYDPSSGKNLLNYRGKGVVSDTQENIDRKWEQGWATAKRINSLDPDYEIFQQNCNASSCEIGRSMGVRKESEAFLEQEKAWVSGWGGGFKNGIIDDTVDFISDAWSFIKKLIFGSDDSNDAAATKLKVLDQPVSDNTGEGVGNGIDASNINVSPSIIDMAGDIFTVAIGLASMAISSIAAGISSAVSFVGGAIGNFLGWLGDLVGIGDNSSASGANTGTAHPIIIDLDNDGLELGNLHKSSVFFDIDGDGYLEKTAWTTGDDGILVVDLFADGEITFGEEINFTLWDETATTDMEALRNVFDSNLNGMLDAEDGRFSDFKIWQDFNQNGFVDENELKTLNEMGISAISLDSRVPVDEDDGIVVAGNVVYDDTDIDWLNGNSGRAYDTALRYSIGGISFDGDDEEFSINYEDGRTVSVYRVPDENTSVSIDAVDNEYDVMIGSAASDVVNNGGSRDDNLQGGSGGDWLFIDTENSLNSIV